MADQVAGLEARGISSCAALNGLLSMPERADVLDRVRLGDIGILIVSPEQLRNKAFRRIMDQREIGAWVLDEAHCLSKWGQDFRPDYRYVGRFIRERASGQSVPPVLCLTATAKPEVVADIVAHFRERLDVDLTVFDGGSSRDNLEFSVIPTTSGEKFAHLFQVLEHYLPPDAPGGAIVYCASRKQTEQVSAFLTEKGLAAGFFHAGMQSEAKKSTQQRFIAGELRVIAATNAFGMGIDKPDVRLVVHADIPGSLENYLQEAGRAGRDRAKATCVLLYCPEDVERQFGLSASSRLTRQEIQAILRALRRLDHKKRGDGEIVATTGEILAEEQDSAFVRDSATDDTRVRTALSWLEEAALLSREQNEVQIFPSSLRVPSLEDAKKKITKAVSVAEYRVQLEKLVSALLTADKDEGISTDELMAVTGLSTDGVRRALYDLEELGIASNDTVLTAFVHVGTERSSSKRFEEVAALEVDLIGEMREQAPDMDLNEKGDMSFRLMAQSLKDKGHEHALPETLWRLLKSIANDGRSEEGGRGSIGIRRIDSERARITLQRPWGALEQTASLRRSAASLLLAHFIEKIPSGQRGNDLLAETTMGNLFQTLKGDLVLSAQVKDLQKLMDRALLWLHEQEVIRLNKGLAVFRPAMAIKLGQDRRGFVKADFEPLQLHYAEQVLQVHVMAEYAQRGMQAMAEALQLAIDYFRLEQPEFLKIWLPKRENELSRQTTPGSWQAIVEALNNRTQQMIVTDDREQTNVLVLAGPGSGKTRVLVHRIAYLVRARRENPHGILALAYNRHAAVEIRRRLDALIGEDSKGVLVMTCHSLAMRLIGASFSGRESMGDGAFGEVLKQAVALLQGEGLPPDERDDQRERLLAGFRWILVDEYQDIGQDQYELISALAGRTLSEDDGRLSLFAVGDDDQNIYSFNGASVEFIRRFEADYSAKPMFLVENYRSTAHIVEAANLLIAPARERMKVDNPIRVDRKRVNDPPGGVWETIDPVGRGRVQILTARNGLQGQAMTAMRELQRLAGLQQDWDWTKVAVVSREWKYLESVRAYCEQYDIPVQMADERPPTFWQLRETQRLVSWLKRRSERLIDHATLRAWLDSQSTDTNWWDLLRQAVDEYALESGEADLPTAQFLDWLAEWGREVRRRQTGLLLLTAHRAKGLEFEHVVVLDGGWDRRGISEDSDAARRLYYVAMTRARSTLALLRFNGGNPLISEFQGGSAFLVQDPVDLGVPPPELSRHYLRLTLEDVDIGFAGRKEPTHPIHASIAQLDVGDALDLRHRDGAWWLVDSKGREVGRLAKRFTPPDKMVFIKGEVVAAITRRKEGTAPEYALAMRCDQWEVVLPELTFAAAI